MIKTIIKAMYSAFISIVLISIILAVWTTYAFIFQSSKSIEISKVIGDLYSSQKSVLVDVTELSKILIKDNSKKITNENKNVFEETEFRLDRDEDSLLDKSTIIEDNGDNPLGIVIQPSLTEVNENILPETNEESLVNEQNEFSMREMEMEMNS
tara:strand:+ start:1021 stop:1482 length:462 start_codon:yes stop_codon:yes gene_type:complete